MTTKAFLSRFGFESLRDLPDMERLEDVGLLSKLLADGLPTDATAVEGDADERLFD